MYLFFGNKGKDGKHKIYEVDHQSIRDSLLKQKDSSEGINNIAMSGRNTFQPLLVTLTLTLYILNEGVVKERVQRDLTEDEENTTSNYKANPVSFYFSTLFFERNSV